jgi:phage gpG-like protein
MPLRLLGKLASGEMERRLQFALGDEALKQVRAGFRKSVAPDDSKWAPHASGTKGSRILVKSGRLRGSFSKRHAPNGFVIVSPVEYAGIHQHGGAIHHKASTRARGKRGRFLAKEKQQNRKGRSVGVTFLSAHTQTIPARPMLPDGQNLGPRWQAAFRSIADRTLRTLKKG